MTKSQRIEKEITKTKEQLATIQAKLKNLEEEKRMAERAEKLDIIEKHKISSEKLQLLKKVNRKAQRCPAMTFPHRNVPVRKNAHSIRWIRNVRSAKRITAFVSM
mgnify:CR=1 FL=1